MLQFVYPIQPNTNFFLVFFESSIDVSLLIVSEHGLGKRTYIDEFTIQKRGGKGVKCYKITEKTGEVIGVKAVNDDHEIMMITTEGIIMFYTIC